MAQNNPLLQGWPAYSLAAVLLVLIVWDGMLTTNFEWAGLVIVPLLVWANWDETHNNRRGIVWLRKRLGFKHP